MASFLRMWGNLTPCGPGHREPGSCVPTMAPPCLSAQTGMPKTMRIKVTWHTLARPMHPPIHFP